ncbi:putative methyltransferase type 11 [Diaporthe ampelina]|uniref:Putative methyltransferase type 11 n=1 Tax=Diaporthe ampelina TaxID=1214573 RepID=A0A0G2FDZ6_9PEZI|nr:putative methyltransferase type 11 [Diaporthe ampelina]
MDANGNKVFAQDDKFWDNYLKGRPQVPDAFFDRIFEYHKTRGGSFGTVHDVGAGNGPYGKRLRSRFSRVIVSDIVPGNVDLARARFSGLDGFSFRAARLEDADDIPAGSVDLVFATNVMHFADPQAAAVEAVARQLRPGGTFAAASFGPARFHDAALQDLWDRVSREGGRRLLETVDDPAATARVMARTEGPYNVAPLGPELFEPWAQRVHLNMGRGGIQGMLPPEAAHQDTEPSFTGPGDDEIFEDEDGWSFETDLAGVKEHFGSFPFISKFPDAFTELYKELDSLLADGRRVEGYYPAKIILATRR